MPQFEARAAEVGRKLLPDEMTLAVVRFPPGHIRLYSDRSFTGTVLVDLGLRVPEAAVEADTDAELSPEQVTDADADFLYVSTYGPATGPRVVARTGSHCRGCRRHIRPLTSHQSRAWRLVHRDPGPGVARS